MDAAAKIPSLAIIILTVCWYLSSSSNAVSSQHLFQDLLHQEGAQQQQVPKNLRLAHAALFLTTIELLTGSCLAAACVIIRSGGKPLQIFGVRDLISGAFHFFGCLFTNFGFALGGASLVQVVKLLEPIETLVLVAIVNSVVYSKPVFGTITCRTIAAVLLIVGGTSLLLTSGNIASTGTNLQPVICALISGLCMSSRNVIEGTKHQPKLQPKELGSLPSLENGLESFTNVMTRGAMFSLATTFIVVIFGSGYSPVKELSSRSLLSATAFFCMYQISSIFVLSLTSPPTHSLLNVGKRIVNIMVATYIFAEKMSSWTFLGLFVAAGGGILYWMEKNNIGKGRRTIFLLLMLVTSYSLLSTLLMLGQISSSGSNDTYFGSIPANLISTSANYTQRRVSGTGEDRAIAGSPTSTADSIEGPVPAFHLKGRERNICQTQEYNLICNMTTREESSVEALPLFADYFVDVKGQRWHKRSKKPSRLIVTDWFQPAPSQCGKNPVNPNLRCANLGDELGALILSKLAGGLPVEKRFDGMDVVVVGSVLNYMVSNYNASASRIGSRYNITVWGAGTKWGVGGVCFDFRAVRGPKTREVFMQHGCNIPAIYGDPALLLPYIYDPRPNIQLDTSIDMCMIPHMDDFLSTDRFEWWAKISSKDISSRFSYIDHTFHSGGSTNSTYKVRLIDIRTPDAKEFVDTINRCKLISSASLHGIILAEAYNITWSWVKLRPNTEMEFKYHDFFLSVGINPTSVKPLLVTAKLSIQELISHTLIPKDRGISLYNPVKLLNACPFCDADIVARIKNSIESQVTSPLASSQVW